MVAATLGRFARPSMSDVTVVAEEDLSLTQKLVLLPILVVQRYSPEPGSTDASFVRRDRVHLALPPPVAEAHGIHVSSETWTAPAAPNPAQVRRLVPKAPEQALAFGLPRSRAAPSQVRQLVALGSSVSEAGEAIVASDGNHDHAVALAAHCSFGEAPPAPRGSFVRPAHADAQQLSAWASHRDGH